MTDRPHDMPTPASPDEQVQARSEVPVEEWVKAALALGQEGLREQIAVPNPKGGYIVVTRSILGAR